MKLSNRRITVIVVALLTALWILSSGWSNEMEGTGKMFVAGLCGIVVLVAVLGGGKEER